MKTKFNYKNLILTIIMVVCAILFVKDWAIVLIKGASFTWFGLITNIILLVIACGIYDHMEQYLEEKENKRKGNI